MSGVVTRVKSQSKGEVGVVAREGPRRLVPRLGLTRLGYSTRQPGPGASISPTTVTQARRPCYCTLPKYYRQIR